MLKRCVDLELQEAASINKTMTTGWFFSSHFPFQHYAYDPKSRSLIQLGFYSERKELKEGDPMSVADLFM